ncbi:MAG: hypothetical protein JWM88_1402 [Verrucomicrobia bacterium]|nr:hypothetical protein [Verrucomicrobiota bacterium]
MFITVTPLPAQRHCGGLSAPPGHRMKFLPQLCALLAGSALLSGAEPALVNLSTRAQVGTGDNILISGFVIGPGANKTLLIRGIGPALAAYGVPGALGDPVLRVFDAGSTTTPIAANAGWQSADAATFAAVGAFPLPPGSKDAALVRAFAPGVYSAQISSTSGATGIASVELYEVGQGTSRLVNISTRALVGTGAGVTLPGFVIADGSGTRRLLVRVAGPALIPFGVAGTLADPTLRVTNSANTVVYATNDNWGVPVGPNAFDPATLSSAFQQAGAQPFPDSSSRDSAILADFAPGSYAIQVSGIGGGTGVALVEVYDITPAGPATATIAATKPDADKSGTNPGEFTVSRSGDILSPLTVAYLVGGTAVNGLDYYPLYPATVTIPSGALSAKIAVSPNANLLNGNTLTVNVSLVAGGGYVVGGQNSAQVTIAPAPSTLYVANVRPLDSAGSSTASGTATIIVNAAGTFAQVSLSFSNLSSAEVVAHLQIGTTGDYVFNLPSGQVSAATWTFSPTGVYSSADLFNALKSGNLYVGIDTANYPTGEARGTFVAGAGSQAFTAPAAPPVLPAGAPGAAGAARLLAQATFGPTQAEVDALAAGSYDAWINAQLAMPFTPHRAAALADVAAYGGNTDGTMAPSNRQAAWFKTALTAPDQLRQRVAFALSEIFVVSDVSINQPEGLANYYDLLGNGAFGNFRTLLEDVTLSPIMGNYLSSLRNGKATATTSPDENYAREVMQLFTIGLNLLQPDGTLKLDASGLPVATYNQATVTEMAKVFTGWSYPSANANAFRSAPADYFSPMQNYAAFHDSTAKNIVNGVVIPANAGAAPDLKLALDALFNHPNCGPFISQLLIQRLVTSNPSPAYVYRVAQVFANDGAGVRGNLAAVVRAILTDYEARSATVAANAGYGKLREPLLRVTGLLRSFGSTAQSGRYLGAGTSTSLSNTETPLLESALRSPTVFNFYHAAHVHPGPLAAAGLVAPEFEITNATTGISVPNLLRNLIFTSATPAANTLVMNLASEQVLAATPAAQLDHLNAVLGAGTLPPAARDRILAALAALPAGTTALERAQTAILLVATSPAGSVQQ